MKYNILGLGIALFFFCMLGSPSAVFNGAKDGLLLWFQTIVPTLFPFLFITDLMIYTNTMQWISKFFSPFIQKIFKTSENGSFTVVVGFLCGYPLGAKVTANLLQEGKISIQEGKYLLSFCNNASPIFIINFILWKTIHRRDLAIPTLLLVLGVPACLSFIFRRFYLGTSKSFFAPKVHKSRSKVHGQPIVDCCIMDAAEAITMVGGYIIIFSVFISILKQLFPANSFFHYFLPIFELSNGIIMLNAFDFPFPVQYAATVALTAFGGLCAFGQTKSVLKHTSIPIGPYIVQKLVTAIVTSFIAIMYSSFL